ncbi:transporter substrate-binding domain-containing protein [Pseudoalteromonas sp. DL2-H2.2]|uniref:substrate-binding periplasmic protein n=1 Tax=Pseudoalteromonas sp. DL2-H2.2 TaxID=2908889 RepID=UPI001F44418A|nr:transporter substrate-binding domain-containing protein [Pseudoalteromonas sp. DL2-H2.2]MCF2908483.1 transporter substrate-binding domain-containing protein [Pseudoalteromonas sp. DL2-H2.2]
MKLCLLLCMVLWLATARPASGATIQVVTEYLYPYQIKNDDGSLGGFMTEVVYALCQQVGDTPDISVMPWARAYQTAVTTENVLIYSIVHTQARSPLFHWIGEVQTEPIFLWGLKRRFPVQSDSLMLLKQHRVAVLRGSNVAHYLAKQQFSDLKPLSYEEQLLQMLEKDRLDLVVGTEETIWQRANKAGVDFNALRKVAELKALNTNLSIALNIQSDPNLVERYRAAFSEISANGQLAAIQQKWFNYAQVAKQ